MMRTTIGIISTESARGRRPARRGTTPARPAWCPYERGRHALDFAEVQAVWAVCRAEAGLVPDSAADRALERSPPHAVTQVSGGSVMALFRPPMVVLTHGFAASYLAMAGWVRAWAVSG
jgi:hypothetical protein